jgi:HMG (high mobility group) box
MPVAKRAPVKKAAPKRKPAACASMPKKKVTAVSASGRPLSAYNIFYKKQYAVEKAKHPALPITEICKLVAKEWNKCK